MPITAGGIFSSPRKSSPDRLSRRGSMNGSPPSSPLGVSKAAGTRAGGGISGADGSGAPPVLGGTRFEDTGEKVQWSINRRAGVLSTPMALTALQKMPVEMVSVGEDFCVALMQNGLLFTWGDGEEGKLGLGEQSRHERPSLVDSLLPQVFAEAAAQSANKDSLLRGARVIKRRHGSIFRVTSVACGARHTVALTSTEEIFTWGSGCSGQLGHGGRTDELLPRPVTTFDTKKGIHAHAVAAGAYHSMAIVGVSRHEPPQLYSWGDGQQGRLGLGDDRRRTVPTEIHHHRVVPRKRVDLDGQDDRTTGGLISFKYKGDWLAKETGHQLEWATLACGGRHSVALTRSGQVYTWGANDSCQLGHETDRGVLQRLPTLLTTLQRKVAGRRRSRRGERIFDVRELGCGRGFTAALTWSGEVWIWGELGGRLYSRPQPLEELQDATIVRIACGVEHIAMLTGDPSLLATSVEQFEVQRQTASLHEDESLEDRRVKDEQAAEEDAAKRRAIQAERLAEKRRVKLIGRLAKQRARQVGKDEKRRLAAEEKAAADAEKLLEDTKAAGGAPGAAGAPGKKPAKADKKK